MTLEYASRQHPGDSRAQILSALVKRGVPQADAETVATAILETRAPLNVSGASRKAAEPKWTDMREMLDRVKENREENRQAIDRLMKSAERGNKQLSAGEQKRLSSLLDEQRQFDERVDELTEQIEMDERAAVAASRFSGAVKSEVRSSENRATMPTASARVTEPTTYSREGRHSYFMDLARVVQTGDSAARARLERNSAEQRSSVGITTVNGAGGEFVPPLWIVEEYVRLARPHRVFADLVKPLPLPAGTDVINLPKVSGGTATAVQAVQNTQVQVTDMVTTSIAAPVFTVAGGQLASLQLIEQSPIRTDEMILSDLAAAYAQNLDTLFLSGSGTGGNPTGILTLAGTNAVTFNGTTLTGANSFYTAIASAISKIWSSRYAAPNAVVMHPRRFAWCLGQVDGSNRPVIIPAQGGAFNAPGLLGPDLNAEGPVGTLAGLPVYLDPNIPTNLGAGTDQDRVIVLRTDDIHAWEGNIQTGAFQQTYANQLSLFLRLHNYAAFQAARYPQSISIISGTGLNLTV
ncbi:phage major capsid protein [Streptomyces sp. NBC_01764]|uniref:phage major capsid protein n=1 Tax=Streptomyces sp. NBC_01764 TaxID=2975935 RepID=UPI002259992D|nr:phage major capsid protein [Streptomyces sp. NBC_01764]MCX4400817.1 phage major capsid protein [Streptomyces sp. NBC_01764]